MTNRPLQEEERDAFFAEIYDIVRQIPPGRVVTYGMLAHLARRPQCARWAGRALRLAPADAGLPCHRVVDAKGRTAPGWPDQRRMLEREGIEAMMTGQ